MSPDRLIYMANQIAAAFAAQGAAKAVPLTQDHLEKFWDPRMRAAIIEYVGTGGAGLTPIAHDAVCRLAPIDLEALKAPLSTG
jgi:formate dehydrogenase subunit delta